MFAAVLFAVTMVALIYTTWKKLRQQPPGPWGLPVVGHLLQMDLAVPHEPLCRWARRHGPIYQVRMGALPLVVVSDPALLRDVLARPEVTARPATVAQRLLPEGRGGISRADGELWGEARRLLLTRLARLGEPDDPLEDEIQLMAVGFLNSFLLNNNGRRVQLGQELSVAVTNILWLVVAGERYGAEDTDILEAVTAVGHAANRWHAAALADAFPFAEQLALMLVPPDLAQEVDELATRLVAPQLARRRPAPAAAPRDFIDAYLAEIRRRPALLSETHLTHCVVDVLLSGCEPTAATLEWAVCFLCARPDVQQRAQQEVDQVTAGRAPRCADRAAMPFVTALLMETQRRGDVTPLGVPHGVTRDIVVAGYRVRRGAQLTPALSAMHLDERRFPEPLQFRPERFLDATGRLLPSDSLLPFLTGRRQCPGEALATAVLFIFLTAMLQRFSFRFPDGFEHDFASRRDSPHVRRPKPFKFVPELRTEK